jgi:hypothetical protein
LPLWPGSFLPDNLLVDQDGDLLFSFYRGGGLSRLDQNGYPVLKVPELGTSVVDLDTGDYVGLVPSGQLARVSYSGQVTTITSVNPALSYWKRVAQDPASGDFLIWDQNPASNQPRALFRATASGVVTTVGIAPPVVLNPIAVFSDPAPDREYVFPSGCAAGVCFPTSPIPGIYTMSRTTGQVSLLYSIGRDPAGNPLWAPLDMVRDRSRRLSTVKSALNRWDLLIDFPGDGNLPYVVLLSLSGIRPGVPLSDGRRLRLNPDPLTYLAGGGQVPGFTGLSGILDQAGRALGLLDASWFPPTTQGVPLWAVGITLDQAAPSGIRTISDTIVVQIR